MPKRRGYANGIQNATLAKIDEAGEKLQNIGSSVENVGKKFLPVTAAASSNASESADCSSSAAAESEASDSAF